MPTPMNQIVRHLSAALLRQDGAALTDGQLLGRFIEHHDESAVEALVRRHGPMVWGVCRRVLGSHHDAEDAFQATFLVLVRKAASVRRREQVGNWLYGVAHQTALKARTMQARRRTRERQVPDMPDTQAPRRDEPREEQALLDQELSRLPDKYRVAIVFCDLEGKTRKAAARQLGLPEGTLAGRLTRGRALLAKRLAQRGVVLSGGALAVALSQEAAGACVPAAVMASTIGAATLVAAGQAAAGLVSAKAVALTEGVLKAMLLTKLKTGTAVLLVLGLVTLTGSMLAWGQTGQQTASPDEPRQTAGVKDTTSATPPPDLKEGVRIVFGGSRNHEWRSIKGDEPAVVARVQGNWVLLKGVEPRGSSTDAQAGCWVNFNYVEWYTIVPKEGLRRATPSPHDEPGRP
jgi:RNA polymerase sigma factor (sigma-70 family)